MSITDSQWIVYAHADSLYRGRVPTEVWRRCHAAAPRARPPTNPRPDSAPPPSLAGEDSSRRFRARGGNTTTLGRGGRGSSRMKSVCSVEWVENMA
ncbi:hypothetical protein J6590_015744 [Homalodisca vitripennis]|nr:hypothetical protein J6590_015744 [Homalodisca vitripennis]